MGSVEKWRRFFEGAEADICSVIEYAILVAASDYPNELRGGEIRLPRGFTHLGFSGAANAMPLFLNLTIISMMAKMKMMMVLIRVPIILRSPVVVMMLMTQIGIG